MSICAADTFCCDTEWDSICAEGAAAVPACGCGGGPTDVCGDGVCGEGESCDGRSGTTACGDCDGKTTGKPDNRFCYVEGLCEGPGCP